MLLNCLLDLESIGSSLGSIGLGLDNINYHHPRYCHQSKDFIIPDGTIADVVVLDVIIQDGIIIPDVIIHDVIIQDLSDLLFHTVEEIQPRSASHVS